MLGENNRSNGIYQNSESETKDPKIKEDSPGEEIPKRGELYSIGSDR